MLCQMGADGATSDKLTLDREHVKPLDVFLIKDPGQHTHTHTHTHLLTHQVCVSVCVYVLPMRSWEDCSLKSQ